MMNITPNYESKCVMARIRRGQKRHQQNFSLKEYGSYEKAELAAKEWVAKMLQELPPPDTTKDKITHRNKSGVVGVRLVHTVNKRPGGTYEYWRWLANWPGCKFPGGIGFSTSLYGEDNSFVLAVIARKNETDNREAVIQALEKIKGTKEYKKILSLKKA